MKCKDTETELYCKIFYSLNCNGLDGHLVIEQGLDVTTQHTECEAETVNRAVQSFQGVGSNYLISDSESA
jgi:hypothetical protein